jgi:hypothetical protein
MRMHNAPPCVAPEEGHGGGREKLHAAVSPGHVQFSVAGVNTALENHTWARAEQLRERLLAQDVGGIEALCTADFWERSGRSDLAGVAPHVREAVTLGALGRRSLIFLHTAGHRWPAPVLEQLWAESAGELLLEDHRVFTLMTRAQVEALGDPEELARLQTKIAAQDAAEAYVIALNDHDQRAAQAAWSHAFAERFDLDLHNRISRLRSAELIGSVGPRTLLRCWFDDAEQTIELLWRRREARLLIEGARVFRPVAGS